MRGAHEASARVVLVGAGHPHLWVATQAGALRRRGAEVTLVAPGPTWYSGMATGMLGGRYAPAATCIDPAGVALRGGAHLVRDRVVGLERGRRTLQLAGGGEQPWDLVSFNVGSRVASMAAPEDGPEVWPAKPIEGLSALRARLEARFAHAEPARIVVAGAGATGCELAANLLALARRCRHRVALTLAGLDDRILPEGPAGAAAALAAHLRGHGATVVTGTAVEAIEAGGVRLGGRHEPAEYVVLATGLVADPLMQTLGLPAHPDDGLRVDARLRSIGDAHVFAAGDCAAFGPRRLPRVGVFGVRQAPVLLANLGAALGAREGRPFRPQRHCLAILDLGDGRGLALRGRRWGIGRWALHLKHRLDRGFVDAFSL